MKLVYAAYLIRTVPKRFVEQYKSYPRDHRFPQGKSVGEIEAAVTAAGDDLAAIKAILPHWCKHPCDECGEDHDVLVHFGEAPDYDAKWQDLCVNCLNEAVALISPSNPGGRHE